MDIAAIMSDDTNIEQKTIISISEGLKSIISFSIFSVYPISAYSKSIQNSKTNIKKVKSDPKIPNFKILTKFLKNSFLLMLKPAANRIIGKAKLKNMFVLN